MLQSSEVRLGNDAANGLNPGCPCRKPLSLPKTIFERIDRLETGEPQGERTYAIAKALGIDRHTALKYGAWPTPSMSTTRARGPDLRIRFAVARPKALRTLTRAARVSGIARIPNRPKIKAK
jgi:hypothetical protein